MVTMYTPPFSPLFATRPAASPAIRDVRSFNSAPAEQLTTLLSFMTASHELARTIVAGRPYLDPADVYTAASRALVTLPTPLLESVVDSHRPIDRVPLVEDAWIAGEISDDQLAILRDAAAHYARSKGHLFIADPAVWGSAEAVTMIPSDTGTDITSVLTALVADAEERSTLSVAESWELTVTHLEESNRLKLVTLLER